MEIIVAAFSAVVAAGCLFAIVLSDLNDKKKLRGDTCSEPVELDKS